MGLCQFPNLQLYWSRNHLFQNHIQKIMSRNRFQLLLKTLHFSDNTLLSNDRLQKITPLVNKLITNFQRYMIPGEYQCIDESLVPFKGRLKFKQYISNKRHKFGIKMFKLCLEGGYTYNFSIYCGKEYDGQQSVPSKVVINLMNNLLDSGRTLCTDNYYTSVSLAHELLNRKTHLIGTLRSNRKFNPAQVIEKKLKKGEQIAAESDTGVVVQKWKDKRDVLVLSTKHTDEMMTFTKNGKQVEKPKNIVEYNKYKCYIDLSDQNKSYNNSLRKSVKWYRKLAFELITGTAFVNAFVAYKAIANEKLTITDFRIQIITKFLDLPTENIPPSIPNVANDVQHKLVKLGRTGRRRCNECFHRIYNSRGRKEANNKTPQSDLQCSGCEKNYCLECFFEVHNVTK